MGSACRLRSTRLDQLIQNLMESRALMPQSHKDRRETSNSLSARRLPPTRPEASYYDPIVVRLIGPTQSARVAIVPVVRASIPWAARKCIISVSIEIAGPRCCSTSSGSMTHGNALMAYAETSHSNNVGASTLTFPEPVGQSLV